MTIKLSQTDPIATAREVITDAGFQIEEERVVPHGVQFRIEGGAVVTVYGSGAVVPGGKNTASVVRAFENAVSASRSNTNAPEPKSTPSSVRPTLREATVNPNREQVIPRHRNPNWSDETWDGVTPPWDE